MNKKWLLIALFPAGLLAAAGYESYVLRHAEGSVDWRAGVIHARGEWPYKPGGDKAAADRGATLKAQENALRLAQDLNIDGDTRLQDDQALVVRARGVIRGGRIVSAQQSGKMWVVELEVPVSGVNSLLSAVVTDFKAKYLPPPPPPPPAPKVAPSAPKSAPGSAPGSTPGGAVSHDVLESLIIDARGSGARPALMPVVKGSDGTPVYTAASVATDDLLSGGQVKYVTAGRGAAWRPFQGGGGLRILFTGNSAPAAAPAGALRIARADGKQRGNLVLAPGEAEKLQTPEAQEKLKHGKVLVIMDPTVGGVDGWNWRPGPVEAVQR